MLPLYRAAEAGTCHHREHELSEHVTTCVDHSSISQGASDMFFLVACSAEAVCHATSSHSVGAC